MMPRSLTEARLTISARMRRPSGRSSSCRRSPERTECESAKVFQPCSVYSNLLLFLHAHQGLFKHHEWSQSCSEYVTLPADL